MVCRDNFFTIQTEKDWQKPNKKDVAFVEKVGTCLCNVKCSSSLSLASPQEKTQRPACRVLYDICRAEVKSIGFSMSVKIFMAATFPVTFLVCVRAENGVLQKRQENNKHCVNVHRFIRGVSERVNGDKRHKPSAALQCFIALSYWIYSFLTKEISQSSKPTLILKFVNIYSWTFKSKLFTIYLHTELSKDIGSNWMNINDPYRIIVSLFISLLDRSPFHDDRCTRSSARAQNETSDNFSDNISSNKRLLSNTSITVHFLHNFIWHLQSH